VKVHCGEGVTNHTGPKPCATDCEVRGEASAGERIGQPLSRDRILILGADAVELAEGNMDGHEIVSARTTRRGPRPWHVWTLFGRKPGDPTVDRWRHAPKVRIGKARSRSR
jgi:hypothetical protein